MKTEPQKICLFFNCVRRTNVWTGDNNRNVITWCFPNPALQNPLQFFTCTIKHANAVPTAHMPHVTDNHPPEYRLQKRVLVKMIAKREAFNGSHHRNPAIAMSIQFVLPDDQNTRTTFHNTRLDLLLCMRNCFLWPKTLFWRNSTTN